MAARCAGGAIFKGAVGTVISISPPETGAEALDGTYLAAFFGLSLPIVGAGVALAAGVSPRVMLLGFAIAVAAGIVASAIKLLPGAPGRAPRQRPPRRNGSVCGDEPNSTYSIALSARWQLFAPRRLSFWLGPARPRSLRRWSVVPQ